MFVMVLLVLNILFVFPFLKIRYKKRERGKLVHAYSSSDVQGILVSWEGHISCETNISLFVYFVIYVTDYKLR